jgi:mRNA interferase MazF
VIGDVVVVSFPFSDLTTVKKRPAFVAAEAEHGDVILCQITSRPYSSDRAVKLTDGDFLTSHLGRTSYARPDKLFTASGSIVERVIGSLRPETARQIRRHIAELFE